MKQMDNITQKIVFHNRKRLYLFFSLLLFFLIAAGGINMTTGSMNISLSDFFNIIFKDSTGTIEEFIVWKIRIPRALASILGGAYLAVAGLLLQVFFRNPIVGPFILGISSGATLAVSLVMLTALGLGMPRLNPVLVTLAAFIGAGGAMLIIVSIASKVKSGVTLLIAGLMIGYLCHAVTSIIIAFAEAEKVKGFTLWQLGSFSGFKGTELGIMIIAGGILLVFAFGLSKPLNAFLLGEEYAFSMGVNIKLFRLLILLCSCGLAGLVTSFAGPVAFIGLAVPHMTRLIFATSDNRILIPGAVLLGGAITCFCDLIARSLFAPVELPISALTSFFGAPIVISLLLKRNSSI